MTLVFIELFPAKNILNIYFGREVVFKENSVIGLKDCSVFTGVKNVLQHNPLVVKPFILIFYFIPF